MKEAILEKDIKIRYSEMDYDLMLKPSALLHFLEDLASENAEELGFGYNFVRKNNLAWFLLKYRMEFINYPRNIYDLKIKTEPRGYNKLFAFRDFEISDRDNVLGKITSTWSLVDMDTRNIAPVAQYLADSPYMTQHQRREDDLSYEKIKPINNVDIEKVYEIRYDDIDVNGHANNSNYIVWAFEPLSFDFRSKKRLKTIDMIYKKEIKYGNKIVSLVEIENDRTNHILKSLETDEELCLVSAHWCDK